jgi:hypothetical protein
MAESTIDRAVERFCVEGIFLGIKLAHWLQRLLPRGQETEKRCKKTELPRNAKASKTSGNSGGLVRSPSLVVRSGALYLAPTICRSGLRTKQGKQPCTPAWYLSLNPPPEPASISHSINLLPSMF